MGHLPHRRDPPCLGNPPLALDLGGFAGLILEPWQKQRIEDARFREKVNAEAPEPITGPLNWSLLDPGPPIEPAALKAAEKTLGMPIPADLIRFLEENGNGGYLRDYICFPIPPECGHTFHLRSLIGIGHPNGNHDLATTLESYSYDEHLAPRLIPVFEDDLRRSAVHDRNRPNPLLGTRRRPRGSHASGRVAGRTGRVVLPLLGAIVPLSFPSGYIL